MADPGAAALPGQGMAALSIHAGETARARILEQGISADAFDVLVGASGGPKWFVLHGLDQYLFGDFFAGRSKPLYTLGSSAGAWRMCCMATADPVAAVDRLAQLYSHQRYSSKPDTTEVTQQAWAMLHKVLGDSGAAEIVANPVFQTHVIADRCRGLKTDARAWRQALHLAASATCNTLSRRSLGWFFERTVFTPQPHASPWQALNDLPTRLSPLREDNVFAAMIASGSIPFVLDGVRNIDHAKEGLYWDGGITDYHFDLPFWQGDGLVLYPHFQGAVIPGWFDKHLAWRQAHRQNYHNVVILAPSPEFVASLPNGKLSDRSDFENFDYAQRLEIFQQVLARGQELATEFAEIVQHGIKPEQVRPIANLK